jgi:hypothetical protein
VVAVSLADYHGSGATSNQIEVKLGNQMVLGPKHKNFEPMPLKSCSFSKYRSPICPNQGVSLDITFQLF